MSECSECGHVIIEIGPAGSGADEGCEEEFDPAPYLRAELVSDLPVDVASVEPRAWCPACRTLLSAVGGAPIEWDASWGEPTSVIAPIADPEGLVRHWMGEMDGPLDAGFTLIDLGRWRGDTLLELYGCYEIAGRGPYWGWSNDEVLPLTRRAVELVEQLPEADFARLSIEGTLAQIYAEHARTLTRAGSDEAIDAWDQALAADDRARWSDEELQADAAECFFFAGDNGAAFELATSLLNHRRQYLDRDVEAQLAGIVADIHRERDEPLEALSWRLEQAWAEINMDPIWQFAIPTEADIEALLLELRHDPDQRAAEEQVRSLVARLEAGELDRYDAAAAWLLEALEASAPGLSYHPAVQQIFDRFDGCPSCGAPVFDLIYDDQPADDADDGFDPRAWMRVWAEPLEEPLAGGTHPTGLCVGCGRAADHYRHRAICWRPASGPGSLASLLVPPVDQPYHAVQHGVDLDADSYAAQIEFLVLRGRWSDDVELEAIALARLLQCMRADEAPAHETREIVRARDLLDDERLSNRSRIELHAEVGRGLVVCRPTDALEHLRAALRLAQHETTRAEPAPRHREGFFTGLSVDELAIDIAECALHLDETEVLEMLR
jgi:hypothetical protein